MIKREEKRGNKLKKYLLLIEDEDLWEKFKKLIDKDINTEIISLIQKRIKKEGKNEERN